MSEFVVRCKRCNRVLTSKESIERGYGNTCYRIMQFQNQKQNQTQINTDIQFLKCEINFLKRQLKELKQSRFICSNIEPIERIKSDEHRPERDQFRVQFNVVVKELKIKLQVNSGEKFDYHNILNPIEPRTEIEEPPIIETIEVLN